MDEYQWIEGAVAVESVLRANSREVSRILIRQDRFDSAVARIQQLAQAIEVDFARRPAETLAEYLPEVGQSVVIARVGPKRMKPLVELLALPKPVIVMLDGVEDPFNFGQAVRSLYAAGIDGLVVRPRNWLSAAATVIRASAGATELMPMAIAEVAGAVASARANGLSVAAATTEDARPMYDIDLSGPLFLIIGGEKRGVARAVQQAADMRVHIPYGREFSYSLGTAGAAAVLAFEIMRQRHERG